MSLSIPQSLLNSFSATLEQERNRLARDVARILGKPEKEVLALVKTMPKVKLQVCDDSDFPTTCPVYLMGVPLVQRCKKPCLLGTGRCTSHQSAPPPAATPTHVTVLTRLERHSEVHEPLWCDEATRNVYNAAGKIVGVYTEDAVLELFEEEA